MNKLILTDENGEAYEVDAKEFKATCIKDFNVEAIEDEELNGEVSPKAIVDHIFKAVANGKEIHEKISEAYPELVDHITSSVTGTKELSEKKKADAIAEKEAKAKAKEEEKKQKEEQAAQLALRQGEVAESLAKGVDVAAEEFAGEVKDLIAKLPEGVKIVQKGAGYGIEIAEGVTEATIGGAIGYLMQKATNSDWIASQIQFWVGDMTIKLVDTGVFDTAKAAAKSLSELLEKNYGKSLTAGNIESYKRMSERTPVEYRNAKADPTAYLAISNMKLPKKGEKETDASFKKRLKAFEKDREEIQSKLADGSVVKRKEILPLVDEVLLKHGLKESTADKGPSITQLLAQFFHATFGLNELLDIHTEGVAEYQGPDSKVYPLTKEKLEELRDTAQAGLVNVLYKTKNAEPADIMKGFIETEIKVEVSKTDKGKPIYEKEKQKVKVYPNAFFNTPSEEDGE
jgi:uncharacterized protein YidB (DUF937 family)